MLTMKQIKERQAAPPSLLSPSVREALHKLGYIEPHYTDWTTYLECGYLFALKYIQKKEADGTWDVRALLGQMLHLAVTMPEDVRELGGRRDFWLDLIHDCRSDPRSARTRYRNPNGSTTSETDLTDLCTVLVLPDTFDGITLRDIVLSIHEILRKGGWGPVDHEKKLRYVDGAGTKHPITFAGAGDCVQFHPRLKYYRNVDIKSWGMWNRAVNDGAIDRQPIPDPQALFLDPQLRHYDWILRRMGVDVQEHGLLMPANLIPYRTSGAHGRAGEIKGNALVTSSGVGEPHLYKIHEADMLDWLTNMANGHMARRYPRSYGKLGCMKCPYLQTCLGPERAQENIPDGLSYRAS